MIKWLVDAPNVAIGEERERAYLVFFTFCAVFFLVHSLFALFHNGFMENSTFVFFFIVCLINLFLAFFASLNIVWVMTSLSLLGEILVYASTYKSKDRFDFQKCEMDDSYGDLKII